MKPLPAIQLAIHWQYRVPAHTHMSGGSVAPRTRKCQPGNPTGVNPPINATDLTPLSRSPEESRTI